ncbi:MAG: glycosyltransferase family 2 protein, partial [Spirochaetia bacterium]
RPHYILVDDKSTDDTVSLLRQTFTDPERYTIVELAENRGVSGAIHAGIDESSTDIVCSMDADCSYDPLELLRMIPLLENGTALVTASPYHADGAVLGVPGWRLFLSRGLSGIYRIFLRHKLATYTSCFRVYRRSVAQRFRPEFGDFRGIVELLARMDMAGEGIREYPTTLQSRIFGFSKMKTLNTIRDHLRLLARMGRYRAEARHELRSVKE